MGVIDHNSLIQLLLRRKNYLAFWCGPRPTLVSWEKLRRPPLLALGWQAKWLPQIPIFQSMQEEASKKVTVAGLAQAYYMDAPISSSHIPIKRNCNLIFGQETVWLEEKLDGFQGFTFWWIFWENLQLFWTLKSPIQTLGPQKTSKWLRTLELKYSMNKKQAKF